MVHGSRKERPPQEEARRQLYRQELREAAEQFVIAEPELASKLDGLMEARNYSLALLTNTGKLELATKLQWRIAVFLPTLYAAHLLV